MWKFNAGGCYLLHKREGRGPYTTEELTRGAVIKYRYRRHHIPEVCFLTFLFSERDWQPRIGREGKKGETRPHLTYAPSDDVGSSRSPSIRSIAGGSETKRGGEGAGESGGTGGALRCQRPAGRPSDD